MNNSYFNSYSCPPNYSLQPGTVPLIGGQYAPLPNVSYSDPFASNWHKSDFTSPRYILDEITSASKFKPIGAASPDFGKQPYGKNPSAQAIQKATQNYLNGPITVVVPTLIPSAPVTPSCVPVTPSCVPVTPSCAPAPPSCASPSPYGLNQTYGFESPSMGAPSAQYPQPSLALMPFGVPLNGYPVGINSYADAIGSIINGVQYGVYPQQVPNVPSNGFGFYPASSPTNTSQSLPTNPSVNQCQSSQPSRYCEHQEDTRSLYDDFYGIGSSPVCTNRPSSKPNVTTPPDTTPKPTTPETKPSIPQTVTIIEDAIGTTVRNYNNVEFQNIRFVGDNGKNSFNLGGKNNRFEVSNLGADDQVTLSGARGDWKGLPDNNPNDGVVVLENSATGTIVTLKTDNRRKDGLISDRLRFSSP